MVTVRLTWTDNSIGETEQRIYRSTSTINPAALPAPLATVGADVTTYADTTAVDDTTYYYRVAAVGVSGVVAVSDEFVWGAVAGPTYYTMAQVFLTENIASMTLPGMVTWQSAKYDTAGIWDAANPTRLTVPAGASLVRVFARLRRANLTSSSSNFIHIRKNGLDVQGSTPFTIRTPSSVPTTRRHYQVRTGVLAVTPGDYFELYLNTSQALSTLNGQIIAEGTSMELEVIA